MDDPFRGVTLKKGRSSGVLLCCPNCEDSVWARERGENQTNDSRWWQLARKRRERVCVHRGKWEGQERMSFAQTSPSQHSQLRSLSYGQLRPGKVIDLRGLISIKVCFWGVHESVIWLYLRRLHFVRIRTNWMVSFVKI